MFATRPRWRRCSRVSTWSAIRRRWSVPAWTPPTRRPTPATTTSATAVLLAEMFAAGCRRLVLASSMVVYGQGRYECPDHGLVDPLPRTRADLDAGVFEHRCPICGALGAVAAGRRGRAAAAAQPVRGRARPRRSITRWRGPSRRAARWSRCAITTSTAPACPATRRTRGSRRSSAPHSKQATCQGFSRTVGRCATSSTSTTSPRPTSRQWRPNLAGFSAFNVCSGRPISIHEVATELCEPRGEALPLVTGQYRSGDVRHIVADPARAEDVLGFRAAVDPRDGLREFAYAPLRE